MKGLPYFQFFPSEWITGDITMESMEAQGLFINICAFYWERGCSTTKATLEKRFRNDREPLEQLLNSEIFMVENDESEAVSIHFLDEQFQELTEKREKKQQAGRKGGRAKSSNAKATLEQHSSNIDKIRIDKNREEENRKEKNNSLSISTKSDSKKESEPEGFQVFWDKIRPYSHKNDNCGNMRKAYKKCLKAKISTLELMDYSMGLIAGRERDGDFFGAFYKLLDPETVRDQMKNGKIKGSKAERKKTAFENFLPNYSNEAQEISAQGRTIENDLPLLYPPQDYT